jgi:pyruvate formate lyase activating enzyme
LEPDFVAVDLKTSPEKYAKLPWFGGEAGWRAAIETLAAVRSRGIPREPRTTLAPGIVGIEDIGRIVGFLEADESYVLNRFRPGRTLEPGFASTPPYAESEMEEMLKAARAKVPGARLR